MTRFQRLKEQLAEINPDALLADGFEDALVGWVRRYGMGPVALYDYEKCIQILMKGNKDQSDREGAEEYFEYNVIGGWHGENTPAFATIPEVPPALHRRRRRDAPRAALERRADRPAGG